MQVMWLLIPARRRVHRQAEDVNNQGVRAPGPSSHSHSVMPCGDAERVGRSFSYFPRGSKTCIFLRNLLFLNIGHLFKGKTKNKTLNTAVSRAKPLYWAALACSLPPGPWPRERTHLITLSSICIRDVAV